ncbi:hypothetical protein HMI55_002753, partial [Coelomomyces lativittatus]
MSNFWFRNEYAFDIPKKSIRGFTFDKYFDLIVNPDLKININEASKIGKLVLQGKRGMKWSFCLEKNKFLFSPNYTFFPNDAKPRPLQDPNRKPIQDCHYH